MNKRIFIAAFIGLSILTATNFDCFTEFAGAQQKKPIKVPVAASSRKPSDKKLEDAIAVLRHIKQEQFDDDKKESKAKEIDAAWEVIKSFGQTGIARLKQEIQSAISLLCQAQHLPALPRIRQLATTSAKDETRRAAVRCLGAFGSVSV